MYTIEESLANARCDDYLESQDVFEGEFYEITNDEPNPSVALAPQKIRLSIEERLAAVAVNEAGEKVDVAVEKHEPEFDNVCEWLSFMINKYLFKDED